MKAQIRPATAADIAGIKACIDAAFRPYIPRIGREPAPMLADYATLVAAGDVWIAVSGAEVHGVLVQYETPEGFYLDTVAVNPACQGTGVGRALLQFAEQEALRRGFDAIQLCTNARMTENQVLYPKIGYVEYDRKPQSGYDRVFYRKNLKADA